MADKLNMPFLILTGAPGVGKTTLVKKLTASLATDGFKSAGFYTEEVRGDGVRKGFDVVTLEGVRGRLARDIAQLDGAAKHKVGKYGVLVKEFEEVALNSLEKTTDTHILVIDEIGKMEFFSQHFKAKIKDILAKPPSYLVLATIPLTLRDPLIQELRDNHRVWTVTRENRNSIEGEILRQMKLEMKNTRFQHAK